MRRPVLLTIAAVMAMIVSGCSQTPPSQGPQIVVTTNILGDVTRQVLGDQATVTTLMQPEADPHSFEISPQQAALMGSADLLVSNGLGLEEGLQQHLDRAVAAGATTLIAGEAIDVVPYSSGAAEGAPDPHFWTDPAAMLSVVNAIEAAAGKIHGIDAWKLATSASAYRAQLAELDAQMTTAFAALPAERRALVTNHHVFGTSLNGSISESSGPLFPAEPRSPHPAPQTCANSAKRSAAPECQPFLPNHPSPTVWFRSLPARPASTSRSVNCSRNR